MAALAPVVHGVVAQQLVPFDDLLLVVQISPPVVQVVRAAAPERPAVLISRGPIGALPDGDALLDCVTAYAGAVLSAHDEAAAVAALGLALDAQDKGGLFLLVHPASGETKLFLAAVGEDLRAALDLGGIVRRVTVH
jgi:hypothetical protein